MLLLVDNYDSFTYNLTDYLLQLGQTCKVIRNDEVRVDELERSEYSAVVISPGPGTPQQAGITMPLITAWHKAIPILGVCLGHQALGMFFGAPLVRATRPVHGKTSVIEHDSHALFERLPPRFEVMRYHSLLLDASHPFGMNVIARNAEGEIMAIAHPRWPLAGFQFHPESILTAHGLQLLDNWLRWSGSADTRGTRTSLLVGNV
jgi:anthranilate synthase/aminodeoxychorismate synthase-like glutamine amidotransferase